MPSGQFRQLRQSCLSPKTPVKTRLQAPVHLRSSRLQLAQLRPLPQTVMVLYLRKGRMLSRQIHRARLGTVLSRRGYLASLITACFDQAQIQAKADLQVSVCRLVLEARRLLAKGRAAYPCWLSLRLQVMDMALPPRNRMEAATAVAH